MFKKFNVKISDNELSNLISKYYFLNENSCVDIENRSINVNEFCSSYKELVEKKIQTNGIITSEDLEDEWFPQYNFQVFISHSHKDEEIAKKLKRVLKIYFNIDCFIDSEIWEYTNDIITNIVNEKFENCIRNDQKYEHYFYTLEVASKVNMILTTALTKMIDKTECLLFLNSDNSVNVNDKIEINYTKSPWIYYELFISNMIKTRTLKEHRKIKKSFGIVNESSMETVDFPVDLSSLPILKECDIISWIKRCEEKKYIYPLDVLYELKCDNPNN